MQIGRLNSVSDPSLGISLHITSHSPTPQGPFLAVSSSGARERATARQRFTVGRVALEKVDTRTPHKRKIFLSLSPPLYAQTVKFKLFLFGTFLFLGVLHTVNWITLYNNQGFLVLTRSSQMHSLQR